MNEQLSDELRRILNACESVGLPVIVIGAFSVQAYDCLFRTSGDLDLAIASIHWPELKNTLASLGYSVITEGLWATVAKPIGEETLEVHIALDNITDFNSTVTFPVGGEQSELHRPADLDFALPVLPLEGVFLTKLIALRDKDIADLVGILMNKADKMDSSRLWERVIAANLQDFVENRLNELIELLRGGEAMSAWYIATGQVLADDESGSMEKAIRRLLKARP